ncbi:MAG: rod shape-determining protein MreD [Candidatus Eremiobacteraeota bacterium]|jgi:rod shape-determining protein MreD|nr:rod shape-determining protein MreD [Candidatus Eremiobacteraeota bacterium]MEA2721083.1 rod shape-determining protein MreD [Candidatus Eremiobacteraeota bacterium]
MEITVGPAYWPVLGWTSLLAFAQTVVVPLLAFRGAVPSLVTIAVVLYASRAGARRGAMLALPAGLLEDIFAGSGGGWTISTTIVALLVGGFSRRMFADGAFVPAVLCGIAVLVRDLMFWSVMRIEGFPAGYALAHAHTSLWRALLTALVAFVWLVIRGRLVTDKTTIERYGYT